MTLNARFNADFAPFYAAVTKAEVQLKSFSEGADKVGRTLDRMTDSFSGRKIIQEAHLMTAAMVNAGGITTLTDKELRKLGATVGEASEKMRKMGIEVPPGFQKIEQATKNLGPPTSSLSGIYNTTMSAVTALGGALGLAFTGTAIINGIKNQITAAMNYADTLAVLKAKTELGYRDLQILEDVGLSTGVSIEALASAVQILQMRLGDGTARKGIQALQLSFDEIKRLSPAEQLTAIGAAIAKIEDPTERAKVAAQVFGRTWKEILPALKSSMLDAAKTAKIVGDAQIDAADRGGDRWSKFWNDQKRGWASWAGDIILNVEKGMKSWDEASRRAAEIRGGPSALPGLPKAPTARIGGGPVVNDVIDPTMISQLEVYGKTLEQTARATEQVSIATKRAADERAKFLEMSKAGLGAEFDWQRQVDLTKWSLTQLHVEEKTLYEQTRTLADFVAEHKGEMFPEPPQGSLDKWKAGQATIRELGPDTDTLRGSLGLLSDSFVKLGQIGSSEFSKLSRGIGSLIAGIDMAFDSVTTLKGGFGSLGAGNTLKGITQIASGIGGIVSIADTAIRAVKSLWNWARGGEEGTVVNPARDSWFAGRSVQDIGDELSAFGIDGETARRMIDAVFKSKTKADFNRTTGAIDSILGRSITDREGLGFAGGTGGRFLPFGAGTKVTLHGNERVMTEAEGIAEASGIAAVREELVGLRRDMASERRTQYRVLSMVLKDALAH